MWRHRDCSYESSFPIVCPLNRRNRYSFLAFICEMFPRLGKPIFKTADTNLVKNWSVLFSITISGLDTLILCLGEVLDLLEIERQQKKLYNAVFANIRGNENKEKNKTLIKNKKRDVACSSKKEVAYCDPI